MRGILVIVAASLVSGVIACSDSPVAESGPEELPFGEATFGQIVARTQYVGRAGSSLRFEVEFRNAGPLLEEFSVSFSCAMLLLIFSNQERTGEPLWDARRDGGECPADGVTIILAPGGVYRLAYGIDGRLLVRDGLGARHVYFSGIGSGQRSVRFRPATR